MKRIAILAALALILFTQLSPAQVRKGQYVVGFYNLENLFDTYDDPAKDDAQFLPDGQNKWTEAKYAKKLENMARVIRAMRDDNGCWHTILGVSEIENRLVLEDLVSQPSIAAANYQIVHYDSPDRRGVDVGLLYDPTKFKLLDSETIPFTFEGTGVKITLDREEQENFRTRDILMAHGLIEGEHCAFYVCHLPSRLGGKGGDLRSLGADIIYRHSQKLAQKYPGIKIAVMGDMNDDPFNESMHKWLHGKRVLSEVHGGDFFNPFYTMLEDGYGTLCYRDVWSIFDQVLVNDNLALADSGLQLIPIVKKKYFGRVFKKDFMVTQEGQYKGYPFRTFSNGAFVGGFSDHFPTYIVIGKQ